MNALEAASQPEQEVNTLESEAIEVGTFACPDIECGAVFSYRRVSCGHFVLPDFCPTCGGSMGTTEENQGNDLMLILVASECSSENLSDWRQLRGQQPPHLLG
jgi:predicted RNA-binding Zn-ribbon protein involved in translation (DUF1610 family)